jgi:hypothetical protein
MHLYRHSTECPSAIQMFLDENPRYWRFVPMTNDEANQHGQIIAASTLDMKMIDIRPHHEIIQYLDDLPPSPPNYQFSKRQYHQQYAFFQSKRDFVMPNMHLDLYNARVIAVSKYIEEHIVDRS